MPEVKIDSCPFHLPTDQSRLTVVDMSDEKGDGSHVRCLDCLAEGPIARGKDSTKREQRAVKLWNKRS